MTDTASTPEGNAFDLSWMGGQGWAMSMRLCLADEPGELASLARLAATHGANIELFHFNRSEHPNLVRMRVRVGRAANAGALADELAELGWTRQDLDPAELDDRATVTDSSGLLRLKISLKDRPGSLAEAAAILRAHQANVIFMAYDGEKAPGLSEIALAAPSAQEVSSILEELRLRNYHFHVAWQGDRAPDVDKAIGLNAVESFLFKLKALLPEDRLDEFTELIDSSAELKSTLMAFRREAGESEAAMAASEVFSKILELGAASISKTGDHFALRLTGPLKLSPLVSMYVLACPTGANSFMLTDGHDHMLIDSSYGLYFRDVKDWLGAHGLSPEGITIACFTHADADHAGWAFPLQEELGVTIHMHEDCAGVLRSENRAHGSESRILALNGLYTQLINRFTSMRAPSFSPFAGGSGERGGFPVVGTFRFKDLCFEVLHSLGGHVPGQVFFLEPEHGCLFTGDYLIDVPSLSDRDKQTLSLARYLMTSTNADSQVFSREMDMLQELARSMARKGRIRVFPGHGDFYSVE